MDKLGLDAILMIVDQLQKYYWRTRDDDRRLSQYAVLSPLWQHAVELRNFRICNLYTHPDDVEDFAKIWGRFPHRRAAFKKLNLHIILPCSGDTAEGHQRNQAKLSSDLSCLLGAFNSWDLDVPDGSLRPLTVKMDCQFDDTVLDPGTLPYQLSMPEADLDKLPVARRITELEISGIEYRALHPNTIGQLLRRMPHLEAADIRFWDPPRPFHGRKQRRMEMRKAMGECVLVMKDALHSLKKLRLLRDGWRKPRDHCFQPKSVLDDDGTDKFCQAIRLLGTSSSSLEELVLCDVLLSDDLFEDPRLPAAQWPALRLFTIESDYILANGKWLYTGDPESAPRIPVRDGFSDMEESDDGEEDTESIGDHQAEDDEQAEQENEAGEEAVVGNEDTRQDEDDDVEEDNNADAQSVGSILTTSSAEDAPRHYWRQKPDPNTFHPLVHQLAKLPTQMPNLKTGYFEIDDWNDVESRVVIQCADEGRPFSNMDVTYSGNREGRRWWIPLTEGVEWDPPEDVIQALEQWAGREQVIVEKVSLYQDPHPERFIK